MAAFFRTILAVSLVGVCLPAHAGKTDSAAPIAFPDGVLDAEQRTAFVTSPKGGIQAITLSDGKVVWTNDSATAIPWLVAGNRLIVRGDRILAIDAKTGKLLRQCDALDFPKLKVPDRCTVSSPLWDPRVTGDTLTARWNAVAYIDRSKGRPFAFEAWTAFNKAVPAGTVSVNLDTGKTTVQTEPKTIDVTAGLVPEAGKPDQPPADLPKKLVPIWQQYHKDQNGRITVMGNRLVGVAMILEKRGQEYDKRIVVNAWDLKTGAAAEPVELVKGKALDIANIVLTQDHRHAGVGYGDSSLAIYSLTDGKRIGSPVKGANTPERSFVAGGRIYFAQRIGGGIGQLPVMLKAVELDTGKLAWERALKPQSVVPLPP